MKIFGTRLKEELTQRKLSQRKLAIAIEVDPGMIGHYIKGTKDPSLETFRKICEILNVSADFLLGLSINTGGGLIFDFVELQAECNGAFCQSAPLHQGGMVLTSLFSLRLHTSHLVNCKAINKPARCLCSVAEQRGFRHE